MRMEGYDDNRSTQYYHHGSTGYSASSEFDFVAQHTDPFGFDEPNLRYKGYDGCSHEGTSIRNTGHQVPQQFSRASVVSTDEYTLPRPPNTQRQILDNVITPIRKQATANTLGSGWLSTTSAFHHDHATSSFFGTNDAATCSEDIEPVPSTARIRKPAFAFNGNGMPNIGGTSLVSTHILPDRLRTMFSFPAFNRMQSRCFHAAYESDDNLVVSAPTASGKTTILELAICRLATTADLTNIKIVYIGPTKALCEERHQDWNTRLHHLGVICNLFTGDSDGNQQEVLKRSQLLVTTPEKWDSITRKWRDQEKLMQLVRLLLIDEVHILNDERGATVEAIVSRMKSTLKSVRFIALSATIPNATDVATWLGKNNLECNSPAALEVFGDEYRPSRLHKVVKSIPCKDSTNDWSLDAICDHLIPELIEQYGNGKPVIIFCNTKTSAEKLAVKLSDHWKNTKQLWPGPNRPVDVHTKALEILVKAGVAFHHAGIDTGDRKAIEAAFLNGDLSIICCTSTLAVGVNLPCYLVIIKNTMVYTRTKQHVEYSDLDITQMLGRAGRPQFGDHGIGIILTKPGKVAKYERLVQGEEMIESHLHEKLIEHLNAEVALGTIQSLQEAKSWLKSTFLYVRMQQNPDYYKIGDNTVGRSIDAQLGHICQSSILELRRHGILEDRNVKASQFGELMAKQYVRLKTMITFKDMPHAAKISQILATLVSAEEFQEVIQRPGEAPLIAEFTKHPGIKYPPMIDMNKDEKKRFLFIQVTLAGISGPSDQLADKYGAPFRQDVATIFSNVQRLVRCLVECRYILADGISVKHGLELSRSLAAKAWDNTPMVIKQLPHVGNVTFAKIQKLGIKTIPDLIATPPHQLDKCNIRISAFGTKLVLAAKKFPILRITAKILTQTQVHGFPMIHCQAEIGFLNDVVPLLFSSKRVLLHFLVLRSDGYLVELKQINNLAGSGSLYQEFSVKLEKPEQTISCYVACYEIAGTIQQAILEPKISPSRFPVVGSRNSSVSRTSSNEFDNDGLDDEDFGRLNDDEFISVDHTLKQPTDTRSNKHINLQVQSNNKKSNFRPSGQTTAIRTPSIVAALFQASSNSSRPNPIKKDAKRILAPSTKIQSPQIMANGKYACNHSCKDKSMCKHGDCCRIGLDKPPGKKSTVATKSTATKGRAEDKTAMLNHKIALLPKHVIKPPPAASDTPSGLAELHGNSQGYTLPAKLVSSTSRLTGPSSLRPRPVATAAQNEESEGDEFDISCLDDTHDVEEILPLVISEQREQSRALNKSQPNNQIPKTEPIRQPKRRRLDFFSDSEPENRDPHRKSKLLPLQPLSKRESNLQDIRPVKKLRFEASAPNHIDENSKTMSTNRKLTKEPELSDNIPHRGNRVAESTLSSTINNDDLMEKASQELAAYHPFDHMKASDLDIMAQFEGCCEFVE